MHIANASIRLTLLGGQRKEQVFGEGDNDQTH